MHKYITRFWGFTLSWTKQNIQNVISPFETKIKTISKVRDKGGYGIEKWWSVLSGVI